MKKGFSTNAFTKFSLSETIEIISDVGYEGLEIVADVPHAFLPLTNEKLKQIKHDLENRKLLVSNINANTVLGWNLEMVQVTSQIFQWKYKMAMILLKYT